MKPSSLSWPLSANSTASHRKVDRVSPCVAMSARVRTRSISSTPSPANAMLVTLSFSASARIHPPTMTAKTTAVIHSSRVSGPSSASALRAASGASGVRPTRGG